MNKNFKVVCIDSNNRPNDIPISKWLVKDDTYTVTNAEYMNQQNKMLGFELAELDISKCFPYTRFAANRFRPFTKEDEAALVAVAELLEEFDYV